MTRTRLFMGVNQSGGNARETGFAVRYVDTDKDRRKRSCRGPRDPDHRGKQSVTERRAEGPRTTTSGLRPNHGVLRVCRRAGFVMLGGQPVVSA